MTTKKEIPVTAAIERLRELLSRATPLPWDARGLDAILRYARKNSGPWDDAPEHINMPSDGADTAAIFAAMNALPALLECASALEAIMGAEIIYTGAIHETLEASDMHVDLTQKARAALDALAKEVGT